MTYLDLLTHYPHEFREALTAHATRIAHLLDRGDSAEVGQLIAHALDTEKHHAEKISAVQASSTTDDGCPKNDPDCMGSASDCHDACESQPVMLRKQAD